MAWDLTKCELCPRRCGANRAAGRRGACGAGAAVEIYRHGAHRGEEPPVSGTRGSGTVFFSRCTMSCLYCQNYPWSQCGEGRATDAGGLRDVFRSLAAAGCHNWNLVSPTPWLPMVADALDGLRGGGVALPVVMNTSGFERAETIEALAGRVDVYLTDLRYARPETAEEASAAPGYVEAARAALLAMWRQAGALDTDGDGIARRGVICRLLILPGRAGEAVENLRWLADAVGSGIAISVMAQYTPVHRAAGRPGWDRGITRAEYDAVCEAAEEIGFSNGWIQEFGEPPPEGLLGAEMKPGGPAAGAGCKQETGTSGETP